MAVLERTLHLHCRELMRYVVSAMQQDKDLLGLPVPLPVEMKIVEEWRRWNVTRKFGAKVCRDIGAFYKA